MQFQIPPSEYSALVDFYASTNGGAWTHNEGWLDPNAPSWHGVTVVASHVGELSLDGNQLSGSIPSSIENLPQLTYLSAAFNQISGRIPASIGNLPQLTLLNLRTNGMTGDIPEPIGNLSRLACLVLLENHLTGNIPPSIGNLTSLSQLYLGFNELTGSIPDLSGLSQLIFLQLTTNQLTGSIPKTLANLHQLQFLDLDTNQLSGSIPDLSNLTELLDLDLDTNELTGSIPNLRNLPKLTSLDFDTNRLSGSIPASLGSLTALTFLDLDTNQLTGRIPDLSALSQLRYLNLSANRLVGSIPATLGDLTNLIILGLGSNRLTGTIPGSLGALSQLRELNLNNNELTGDLPPFSLSSPSVFTGDISSNSIVVSPGSQSLANINALLGQGAAIQYLPQKPGPPFTGYAGAYAGISYTQPFSPAGAGFIRLTLEGSGHFTAAIIFGGRRRSIKGALAANGNYLGDAPNTSPALSVSLKAVLGSGQITGSVSQGGVTAQLLCEINPYSGRNNPCPNAGRYTFQFEPLAPGATPQPEGSGVGVATVSPAGLVSMSGTLPDGTRIAEGGFVSGSAGWSFYSAPYLNRGLLTGRLVFENIAEASDADGSVLWVAPASRSGLYSTGFQGVVSAIASIYTRPPKGSRVLPFANVAGNAEFTATNGILTSAFSDIVTLSASNAILPLAPGADQLKLSLNLSTGALSGSFIPPGQTRPAKIEGVVFQKQGVGCGFFLSDGQSGGVALGANP